MYKEVDYLFPRDSILSKAVAQANVKAEPMSLQAEAVVGAHYVMKMSVILLHHRKTNRFASQSLKVFFVLSHLFNFH